jgi:hypothetical protein
MGRPSSTPEEPPGAAKSQSMSEISPNKAPLRMPVSGTPAAASSAEATEARGAPVAPPPGIAGR